MIFFIKVLNTVAYILSLETEILLLYPIELIFHPNHIPRENSLLNEHSLCHAHTKCCHINIFNHRCHYSWDPGKFFILILVRTMVKFEIEWTLTVGSSAIRSNMGSIQPRAHSQWASRKVRTSPIAASAPVKRALNSLIKKAFLKYYRLFKIFCVLQSVGKKYVPESDLLLSVGEWV